MFARLVPFVYNSRDSLVLVFQDLVMTVVKNGAPVQVLGVNYTLTTPYVAADLAKLSYVQSGNTVTLVHPSYAPRELKRIADDNWTIGSVVFGATIAAPTAPALSAYVAAIDEDLFGWVYVVTAISNDGEESLASSSLEVTNALHHKHPLVLSWTASTGGQSYRIYRRPPKQAGNAVGAYGLAGVSTSAQFVDYGRDPDFVQQPPIEKVVFNSADNYPSAVGYWQQRRIFSNSNTNPNRVWASQTGRPTNFNISVPVKDDDAVQFDLVSDTVDEVRHIFAQGQLTLLTEGGEWPVFGDQNGALTPATINPRKVSSHGVGTVRPVPASSGLLFPQALGSTILGLDGTVARDLTLFSTHLFDGHQIVDMAWQQETPHVAWFVRDDGVLLGLTYIPDQDVVAWHRHDMDGVIITACTVPELVGNRIEHRVYIVVGRKIPPSDVFTRYTVEVFASPFSSAIDEEAWFVDGGVEHDGRDTNTPASSVSGLDHLEGFDVAIYAFGKVTAGVSDGLSHVVANPLRSDLGVVTVAAGAVALGGSYLRAVVGLPFIADLETLDIDAGEGPTVKTQRTNVSRVGLQVLESRNIWAGGSLPDDATPTADMTPLTLPTDADVNTLVTDFIEINTKGEWNTNGRVALRSIDPTPFTVLSAVPEGYFPNPQEG
jgi:hypothetical protein